MLNLATRTTTGIAIKPTLILEPGRDNTDFDLWNRYYNPSVGRFSSIDPFGGNLADPVSIHKYLYVHNDPVNYIDPSGMARSLLGLDGLEYEVEKEILAVYEMDHPGDNTQQSGRWSRLGNPGIGSAYSARPDILNQTTKKYAEVKPLTISGIIAGEAQMLLRQYQFERFDYAPDEEWRPSQNIIVAGTQRVAFVNIKGLILYTDRDDLAEDVAAIATFAAAKAFFARYSAQSLFGALGRVQQLATVRVSTDSVRMDSQLSIGSLLAVMGAI